MPRFDGTGPSGAGPMTGGRMGRCFGFGNWFRSKASQKKSIADYRKALEEELKAVREEEATLLSEEK